MSPLTVFCGPVRVGRAVARVVDDVGTCCRSRASVPLNDSSSATGASLTLVTVIDAVSVPVSPGVALSVAENVTVRVAVDGSSDVLAYLTSRSADR